MCTAPFLTAAAMQHRNTPARTLHKGGTQEPRYVEIRRAGGSPPRVTVTLAGMLRSSDPGDRSSEPPGAQPAPSEPPGAQPAPSEPPGAQPAQLGQRPDTAERSPRVEPGATDEAHYITTHEIQLCEADQEPDYPAFGLAPSTWGEPLDSAPCPFLEYASFDSQTDEDCSYYLSTASEPNPTDSPGHPSSVELLSTASESDTPPACSSTDPGVPSGQILLSIKTTSKAINELGDAAKPEADMSSCVSQLRGCGGSQLPGTGVFHLPGSAAHRLVALPARLQARSGVHADISSGASSAVSELDDADKEVRNLTARAFRSLAYPYFEAISSSESSASLSDQHLGINSWSTYLDWKGGALLSHKPRHQSAAAAATSSLQKALKEAPKEQLCVQSNKSQTKAFQLVLSKLAPKGAGGGKPTCTAKRIQSEARVVTLTETLNYSSSNVRASAPGTTAEPAPGTQPSQPVPGPQPSQPVPGPQHSQTAPGTQPAPGPQPSQPAPGPQPAEAMDGPHKSKLASSLLKNVISKKMQREQELKMERGELTDTSQQQRPGSAEPLQRQNSRYSEAGSDLTLVSSDDLTELFDFKAAAESKQSPGQPLAESKRSASEAMRGFFPRSQHSAFSSWKEKEIQKMERKIEAKVARKIRIPLERDWRAELGDAASRTATKMSRLYVPGISVSTYAHQSCFSRNEAALELPATPRLTPRPLEMKSKDSPFNITKLLTPNLGAAKAAEELRSQVPSRAEELRSQVPSRAEELRSQVPSRAEELRSQVPSRAEELRSQVPSRAEELRSQVPSRAEVLDKMPQFLVRDVRETKPKVAGAMHQVRDVRKLLKSSYQGDAGSDRASVGSDQSASALSPIVITCQAVKSKEEGGPGEDDKTVLVHRASGRLPVATIAPNKSGPRMPVVKIVSKASKWKQEKPKEPEVKPEPKSPQSRAALEKLTAAVKTMEQLYVYDKKEWKRKSDPGPQVRSHVLACEQLGTEGPVEAAETTRKVPQFCRRNSNPGAEKSPAKPKDSETKAPPRTFQVPKIMEAKSQADKNQPGGGDGGRSVFTVSAAPGKSKQQGPESSLNGRNTTRPQPPSTLNLRPHPAEDTKMAEPARKASTELENYITIPGKAELAGAKPPVTPAAALCSLPPFSTKAASPKSPIKAPTDWRSKLPSRAPSEPRSPDSVPPATIYHQPSPPMPVHGAPIFYSPPLPTATPAEMYAPQTQRKMLVDLATGQYYLVDTPVQPAKRRLYDPETGQYVDVPVPPMPLHMPPLALSPGAYGAAYMFYPGFLPTAAPTVLPASTLQAQISHPGSEHSFDMCGVEAAHPGELGTADGPYYLATGAAPGQASSVRRGSTGCPEGKQLISILSQPGPRIVAPPSFDGTTMRFVVEHR